MSKESIKAYVLINVSVGREYDIVEKVREIDGVEEAHVVYGEYDIIVKISGSYLKEIEKAVMKIRHIDGVIRSTTLITT